MPPRVTRLLRFAFALALPVGALACGEETANDAPIIDSIEAPLVVKAHDGAYAIPLTLLFHDNDGEAVTRLHYRLPPSIDGVMDVPNANPTRESAEVTLVIEVSALDREAAGTSASTIAARGSEGDEEKRAEEGKREPGRAQARTRTLYLSIVDGRGAESRAISNTVTLD